MPRICKMWGFEEDWPKTVWSSHGWYIGSHADTTTDFGTWYNSSPTAGFVTGSKSMSLRHSDAWVFTASNDDNPFHEASVGAGAYASGRLALSVMVDNLGGVGLSDYVLWIQQAGTRMDGGGIPWTSGSWKPCALYAGASGSTHILTLYVGGLAQTVLPITIGRQVAVRFGMDYFMEDNKVYARATANGVPVSDWYSRTQSAYTPPGSGLQFGGDGINGTNSTSGLTSKAYITCVDDIIFVSDTISAIDTTTQVVTRAEAEPPCPSANYFVRPRDVSSIASTTGTYTGTAGDIDIDSSDDITTKVETTDTTTGKPLEMDVTFAALSGTAPASILGQTVRCLASSDTFVTDIQISEDNFSNSATQADTLGTSATLTEISSSVKVTGGAALDVAAVDATKLRFRVTA